MNLGADVVEAWQISARINLFLLDAVDDEQFDSKIEKSKSVRAHFAHIHNVRLMWLKSAAPELLKGLEKLEDSSSRKETKKALEGSAKAIELLVKSAIESGKSVKGFKPSAAAFVCYMVAHEAFHRSQIELVLRQSGSPINDKTAYGMWEWGVR